jgi:hypothetical protein
MGKVALRSAWVAGGLYRAGKHVKIPLHGMPGQAWRDAWIALFVDRDRVWHRTAIRLSFARFRPKLPATAGQPAERESLLTAEIVFFSQDIALRIGMLAAETLFFSRRLSFRRLLWVYGDLAVRTRCREGKLAGAIVLQSLSGLGEQYSRPSVTRCDSFDLHSWAMKESNAAALIPLRTPHGTPSLKAVAR